METLIQHHEVAATFIARVFLGTLFLFQGWDAVVNVKVPNIIASSEYSLHKAGIPKLFITMGAWFTSYVELIAGVFLILGLFEYMALYLLGFDLLIASIAFSISKPMWDMRFVFPRLILLLFLLSVPVSWNQWSMDRLLFSN